MPGPQQVPQGRQVTMTGMPEADGLPPLFDAGNVLLATSVPCNMAVGKIPSPGGELGVLTIRTTTTTLTLTLTRKECEDWVQNLTVLRDALSGAGLQVASKPGGGRLIVPGA